MTNLEIRSNKRKLDRQIEGNNVGWALRDQHFGVTECHRQIGRCHGEAVNLSYDGLPGPSTPTATALEGHRTALNQTLFNKFTASECHRNAVKDEISSILKLKLQLKPF